MQPRSYQLPLRIHPCTKNKKNYFWISKRHPLVTIDFMQLNIPARMHIQSYTHAKGCTYFVHCELFSPNLSNCLDKRMQTLQTHQASLPSIHWCASFEKNCLQDWRFLNCLPIQKSDSKSHIPSSHWEKGSFFCILYCHRLKVK